MSFAIRQTRQEVYCRMKKIAKLLVVTALLVSICAMPVMAREVSFSSDNTDYLITMLNNNANKLNADLAIFISQQCGPNADAVIAAQKALVANKIAAVNKECAQNHIEFLKGRVYNKTVLLGTRLQQLNSFKALAAGSPTWNDEVAAAQKEYDTVAAEKAAAEAYLAAAQVKLAPYLQ